MSDKRSTYVYPIDKHGEITAHINDFVISQESFACTIGLELGSEGMRPYFLHLDDAELAIRHPLEVRKAKPVAPIRPTVGDPHFSDLFKLYESDKEEFNLYHSSALILIAAWFDNMTEGDQRLLRALDPVGGQSTLTLNKMYKFIMTRYGEFSDTAQTKLRQIIEGALSLSESLESNLTMMQVANSTLMSHGLGLGYSENLLFIKAFDKLKANPRTKEIAEDFKKREGYTASTATFSEFKKFVITQYDVRSPPSSTAAFAFAGDHKDDLIDSFAAAVISPERKIQLTQEEYDSLVSLASSRKPKDKLRPAPGYCIIHGFCNHGPGYIRKSTKLPAYCNIMSDDNGNPKESYTKDQVLCKSPKGGPVSGMPRCQDVQSGFKKP